MKICFKLTMSKFWVFSRLITEKCFFPSKPLIWIDITLSFVLALLLLLSCGLSSFFVFFIVLHFFFSGVFEDYFCAVAFCFARKSVILQLLPCWIVMISCVLSSGFDLVFVVEVLSSLCFCTMMAVDNTEDVNCLKNLSLVEMGSHQSNAVLLY